MNSKMKAKIKDVRGYVKDTVTGAILNDDLDEIETYKARQAAKIAEKRSKVSAERIDNMEKDISEIKEMIKALANGNINTIDNS